MTFMWWHCNVTLHIRLQPTENNIKFAEFTVSYMKRKHFSIVLLLVTLHRQSLVAWFQWPLSNFRYMFMNIAYSFMKCIVTVVCVVHSYSSWQLNGAMVQIDKKYPHNSGRNIALYLVDWDVRISKCIIHSSDLLNSHMHWKVIEFTGNCSWM